ncbi:hypothetical protein CKALI_04155 [Corynebacterium kalinowskii]|uniref:DUF3040 domain-containing protein n=1 Tax=Corynebacterium kalinowskii TaxID=2675216 RepID=A0A6B8VWQ7_9CORY|nr:DUF3040 domain-containing protein [Corynebacterium kalinowskii]QGU01710.1 hypothetical protein CKALI_04155 [Corynebacterium kalinowskii]
MSLSEQELRALREIEQSLLADDPKFGASVASATSESRVVFSLQAIALFVLGLVLLIGGIALSQTSMWFVALSVFGFLVMLGSGIWMLRSGDSSHVARVDRGPKRNSLGTNGGFAGRMDERFRSRFEDGQF